MHQKLSSKYAIQKTRRKVLPQTEAASAEGAIDICANLLLSANIQPVPEKKNIEADTSWLLISNLQALTEKE